MTNSIFTFEAQFKTDRTNCLSFCFINSKRCQFILFQTQIEKSDDHNLYFNQQNPGPLISFENEFLVNVELINHQNSDTMLIFELISGQQLILTIQNENKLCEILIFLKEFSKQIFPNFESDFFFHKSNFFQNLSDFRTIVQNNEKLKQYCKQKMINFSIFNTILFANRLFGKFNTNFDFYPIFPNINSEILKSYAIENNEKLKDMNDIQNDHLLFLCQTEFNFLGNTIQSFDDVILQQNSLFVSMDFYDNPFFTLKNVKNSEKMLISEIVENDFNRTKNENEKEKQNQASTNLINIKKSAQEKVNLTTKSKNNQKLFQNEQTQKINIFLKSDSIEGLKELYKKRKFLESNIFKQAFLFWIQKYIDTFNKKANVLKGLEIKTQNEEFFIYNQINLFIFEKIIKKVDKVQNPRNELKTDIIGNYELNVENKESFYKILNIDTPFVKILTTAKNLLILKLDFLLKKATFLSTFEINFNQFNYTKIKYFRRHVI